MSDQPATYVCDHCPIRRDAELNPNTLKARMWRLHTRFCPMWNSYAKVTGTPRPYDAKDDSLLGWMMAAGLFLLLLPALLFRRRRK